MLKTNVRIVFKSFLWVVGILAVNIIIPIAFSKWIVVPATSYPVNSLINHWVTGVSALIMLGIIFFILRVLIMLIVIVVKE